MMDKKPSRAPVPLNSKNIEGMFYTSLLFSLMQALHCRERRAEGGGFLCDRKMDSCKTPRNFAKKERCKFIPTVLYRYRALDVLLFNRRSSNACITKRSITTYYY
jgi:hypothetical protein